MSTLSLVRRETASCRQTRHRRESFKGIKRSLARGNTPASAVCRGVHRVYPRIPGNVFAIHGV